MITKSIRATAFVGLLAAAALVAAPLSAAGSDTPPFETVPTPSPALQGPNLADDMRDIPAAIERADKLGIERLSSSASTLGVSTGVHRIYFSTVDVIAAATENENANLTEATARNAVAAIDAFWQEQSAGKVRFQFGGFETRPALGGTSCNPDAVALKIENAAFSGYFANGKWVGTGNHLVVLSNENAACSNGAAFGTVGYNGGTIFSAGGLDSALGVPTLYHEFGHNLGFGHANAAVCRTKNIDAVASAYRFEPKQATSPGALITTSIVCPVEQYGDLLDIMGYTVQNGAPHASSVERSAAGWLATSKPGAGKKTTVALRSLNNSTGTRAIRVTDPRTGAVYFVEYRTNEGRDVTSWEFQNTTPNSYAGNQYSGGYFYLRQSGNVSNGMVRVLRVLGLRAGRPLESVVLAVAPVSDDGKARLNSLQAGQSFVTAGSGTKITVNSLSPAAGANITVTTAKSASKVASKPAKSTIKKKKTSKLAIVVAAVGNSKPTGTVTVYAKGKKLKAYSLSASKSGRITVTLPKFTKKGTYTITVKYSGSATVAASASKSVKLKVK